MLNSRYLCTACRLDSKQVSSKLLSQQATLLIDFDKIFKHNDILSR